jgi:hypothetical protein
MNVLGLISQLIGIETLRLTDWVGNPDTRRSTIGYMVFLGTNPLTWVSKKQSTVSRSSIEAQYRALASCAVKVSWLCMVLREYYTSLTSHSLV